jgi:hypothetical protein
MILTHTHTHTPTQAHHRGQPQGLKPISNTVFLTYLHTKYVSFTTYKAHHRGQSQGLRPEGESGAREQAQTNTRIAGANGCGGA